MILLVKVADLARTRQSGRIGIIVSARRGTLFEERDSNPSAAGNSSGDHSLLGLLRTPVQAEGIQGYGEEAAACT